MGLGLLGLFVWTFNEYAFHRWVMHARSRRLGKLLHQERARSLRENG